MIDTKQDKVDINRYEKKEVGDTVFIITYTNGKYNGKTRGYTNKDSIKETIVYNIRENRRDTIYTYKDKSIQISQENSDRN